MLHISQYDICIKEQSQAFYSTLTYPLYQQEVMGIGEFTRFQFWPPWPAARISKFQPSSELFLPFITPQYLTLHANYTLFALHLHKSSGYMQQFSETLFKKSSGVSQVLLSNMKNPG